MEVNILLKFLLPKVRQIVEMSKHIDGCSWDTVIHCLLSHMLEEYLTKCPYKTPMYIALMSEEGKLYKTAHRQDFH